MGDLSDPCQNPMVQSHIQSFVYKDINFQAYIHPMSLSWNKHPITILLLSNYNQAPVQFCPITVKLPSS